MIIIIDTEFRPYICSYSSCEESESLANAISVKGRNFNRGNGLKNLSSQGTCNTLIIILSIFIILAVFTKLFIWVRMIMNFILVKLNLSHLVLNNNVKNVNNNAKNSGLFLKFIIYTTMVLATIILILAIFGFNFATIIGLNLPFSHYGYRYLLNPNNILILSRPSPGPAEILNFSGAYCYFNRIQITLPIFGQVLPLGHRSFVGLEKILGYPLYVVNFVIIAIGLVVIYLRCSYRFRPKSTNSTAIIPSYSKIFYLIIDNLLAALLILYFLNLINFTNQSNTKIFISKTAVLDTQKLLGGFSILVGLLMAIPSVLHLITFCRYLGGRSDNSKKGVTRICGKRNPNRRPGRVQSDNTSLLSYRNCDRRRDQQPKPQKVVRKCHEQKAGDYWRDPSKSRSNGKGYRAVRQQKEKIELAPRYV